MIYSLTINRIGHHSDNENNLRKYVMKSHAHHNECSHYSCKMFTFNIISAALNFGMGFGPLCNNILHWL